MSKWAASYQRKQEKSEFDKPIAGTDQMQLQISWLKVILSSAIYYLKQDFTGIIIIIVLN